MVLPRGQSGGALNPECWGDAQDTHQHWLHKIWAIAVNLLCSPQHLSRGRTLSSGPVGNGSEYLARLIWGPFKDHPKVPSESPELLLKQQSLPGRGEAVVPETCPNHPAQRTNVTGPRELLFLCHWSLAWDYRDTLNSSKSNSRLPFSLFSPSGSTPFITLKCQSILRDRCYILAFYNITRPRRDTVSLRKWTPYPVSEGLKSFKETEEAVNPHHILILSSLSCPLSIPAE